MSKERLEEIIDGIPYSIRYSGELELIIGYAKEQAERLEAIIKHRNDILKANEYLNEQNKRYREALSIISANLPLDEREHYVDIARKALEGDLE